MKKVDLFNIKGLAGGVSTPKGYYTSAVSAGIKSGGALDMGLLLSKFNMNVSAVFTKNRAAAAPVIFSKDRLAKNKAFKGILVNSGNANAATGKRGVSDCRKLIDSLEDLLEIPKGSLLIASTGVIGEFLPVDSMIKAFNLLKTSIGKKDNFFEAIKTTDAIKKELSYEVNITKHRSFRIGGVAKGAGMIAPEMATMLAFITTDLNLDTPFISDSLKEAVNLTFNRITVDGDMSTNDVVFLFSNGASNITLESENERLLFKKVLKKLCKELALRIVSDGEGAKKCVLIYLKGAESKKEAKKAVNKLSNSLLFKTMLNGEDPNWGRIIASLGASKIEMLTEKIDIFFNNVALVKNGGLISKESEKKVAVIMKKPKYTITINLNEGKSSYYCYTCDIGHKYVEINADYRS